MSLADCDQIFSMSDRVSQPEASSSSTKMWLLPFFFSKSHSDGKVLSVCFLSLLVPTPTTLLLCLPMAHFEDFVGHCRLSFLLSLFAQFDSFLRTLPTVLVYIISALLKRPEILFEVPVLRVLFGLVICFFSTNFRQLFGVFQLFCPFFNLQSNRAYHCSLRRRETLVDHAQTLVNTCNAGARTESVGTLKG